MKLRQIVISGKQESTANGFSNLDFNLSTAPFFQFMKKGLGRGKDFLNVKKLSIELYSDDHFNNSPRHYITDEGSVLTVQEGNFDFEAYALKNAMERTIQLAFTVKAVLEKIHPGTEETLQLIKIIDHIIETAPEKEEQINEYIGEIKKMMKDTPILKAESEE